LYTTAKSTLPINIYISSASTPEDQTLLGELERHLSMLKRQSGIVFWDKRSIVPGANRRQEIATHIGQAHLILLLLSPDFLASNECYEEMELAARRMDAREAHIIPIIMRPIANWQGTPIGQLEPLPTDREAISNRADQGKALSDIAQRIGEVVGTIRHNIPANVPAHTLSSQFGNAPAYTPSPQFGNIPSHTLPPQFGNTPYGAGISGSATQPVKPGLKIGLSLAILIIAILTIVIVARTVVMPAMLPSTTADKGSSQKTIDPTASSIITNIQTASAIDTILKQPTMPSTSFKTYTDIYTTFQLNLNNIDISQQNPGYIQARYYKQNASIFTDHEQKINDKTTSSGYFKFQYHSATTDGVVKLYWCRQSNCSDAKLAQTASFTVS
jgi:TIR domain-containing protein